MPELCCQGFWIASRGVPADAIDILLADGLGAVGTLPPGESIHRIHAADCDA